jgi:hypothetical protein
MADQRTVGQHRMAARTALDGRTLADSLAELRTLEVEATDSISRVAQFL